jgi:serine/threonine protein kinase
MSVSIDEDPSSDHESAESVLAGWLDDYHAGRCERTDMEEAFISVCSSDPEAPWDALSLLDRYQRLGRIDVDVARELKSKISQIAVGAPKGAGAAARPQRAAAPTRWRKAAPEEQEPESGHTDDIEAAATAIRRPPTEQAAIPPSIPLRNAEEEEEDEEDDDLDDEAAPPAPLPSRSVPKQPITFAERASQIRKAPPAREVRQLAPAPIPQRQREAPSPRARGSAAPARRVLRERYELLAVLGHGQTSTIYKALDRHRANLAESARYVAVKVLNAAYDSQPEALANLEREFHQAQSLSHPNIASVFDLDRDEDTYFIVMELLEGDSLAGVLRRLNGQPMSQKNAFALIGAIGAALAHAHRRDIVHGDLKPRNVMITSTGEVRVLEFGFARSRSAQSGELHDEHGNVSIGTPAYASAERVHGLGLDPSDDVYSLACIAYELLSGRHPYGGRSAFLARAHGRRASRISSLTHRQWHALQRALAWDRTDRKIDVVDFLSALGTGESAHDLVPPELLSIPDDVRGRRLRRLAAVAAVIAVVAFGVYLITRIPPPVQSVDVASAVPAPAPSDAVPDASVSSGRDTQEAIAGPTASTVAKPKTEVARPASTPEQGPQQAESRVEAESTAESSDASVSAPATPAPAAPPATIEFAKDTFVVTESESAVSLEVRRTGSTREVLNFRWTLRSNSAEAGSDFAAIGPGLERIPAGTRTATILIPLVSDSIVENTELFLVELEPIDEGVSTGEIGHAAVIVVDDD